jgi:cytochrome P450
MYLVSRYEDLQTVLHDSDTFSMEKGYNEQFVKGYADEFKEILRREGGGYFVDVIMTDPPRHTRPRRLLEKVFTARRVKELEPRISAIAAGVIEKFVAKKEADGVADGISDFAVPVTIEFICDQLGLGQLDPAKVKRWSDAGAATLGRMDSREQMLVTARDMCDMQLFLIEQIRKRQQTPTEDLLSDLVHVEIEGDENPRLSFAEIVSMAKVLLAGGNETVAAAMSKMLLFMATRPEFAEKLRQAVKDERELTRFVEEFLRVEPPVRGLARMTTREVELGGKKLPVGAHLLLLFASGNDDESQFACPRAFDSTRSNVGRHLSFGAGVHRCVGMALARTEVKIAAKELTERLENFKLVIPEDELPFVPTVALHALAKLPLTFSRRV